MSSARVVIEAVPASGGFEFRVWQELDGHASGEMRTNLFTVAYADLMARLTNPLTLTPFEPGP